MTDSKITAHVAAEHAEGLLGLLAGGSDVAEAELAAIRSTLSSGDAAWEALRAWVSCWPLPPAAEDDFRRWLAETEHLARASQGLARLGLEKNDKVIALRRVLSDVLETFEQHVGERDDHCLFAGDAERIGLQIAPWSWLRGGTVDRFLALHPDATDSVCRLWMHGRIHSKDAAKLRATVRSEPSLGDHERPDPPQLAANAALSFRGSVILGLGFILSPDERAELSKRNRRNDSRMLPYLGGKELNTSPTHDFDRYVISFGQTDLEEAEKWPELLKIVREKVKPERDTNTREDRRRYWWRFGEDRAQLYRAIAPLKRCLATSQVSKHLVFAFQPTDRVFSDTLYVFAFEHMSPFAVLQSRIHSMWAWDRSPAMRAHGSLRYSASDCFETFPFPQSDAAAIIPALEKSGQQTYDVRAKYMVDENVGLTTTYNRLKDPAYDDAKIIELRSLHEGMDRAVLDAYGWNDVAVPPFCPMTQAEKGRVEKFEADVIDRLFALSAVRFERETIKGLGKKPKQIVSKTTMKAALRDVIARECSELSVTRWKPEWSVDVARSEADLSYATELLRLPMPHTGKQLLVRQHALGTWWNHPAGDSKLVPFETLVHTWRDEELGEFTTTIHVSDPSPAQDARHGLGSLQRIADGLKTPRNLEIASAVTASLQDGVLGNALRDGHRAFEQGADIDDVTEQLVRHALEARLLMPDVSMALANDGIDIIGLNKALAEIDEIHRTHGSALQLIPDELYDECVDRLPLDQHEWWGSRAHVDAAVPRGLVDVLLRDLGAETSRRRAGVTSIDDARVKRSKRLTSATRTHEVSLAAASKRTHTGSSAPCAWLRENGSPVPGCVPLLLLDEAEERGIVAELRVHIDDRSDDIELWSGAEELQRLARDVIRDAYYACAASMPKGATPPPFGRHRLELVVDSSAVDAKVVIVDGRSVGLPAALAFMSAWSEQPIAPDVVGIGTVLRDKRVTAVGGVREKVQALLAFTDRNEPPANATTQADLFFTTRGELRVITAASNEADVRAAKAQVTPVATLNDAFDAAGLAKRVMSSSSHAPSIKTRVDDLRELVGDIETGDLAKYGSNARWEQLGDDLRGLIRSLEDAPGRPVPEADLSRARCIAALAYSHAGFLADVSDVLHGIDRPADLRLDVRTLFDIVRLGSLIDSGRLSDTDGVAAVAALTADLEQLRGADESNVLGRAAGTLGRAYLHMRELDRAIPLLQEAVRTHALHQQHETGRSRIYVSMAQRMLGRPQEALEQLLIASGELEVFTYPYSPPYEASTRTFLDYELARVLVSLERYDDANRVATRAIQQCQWSAWPQLGLLRVRAWALRACGRVAEADADVEQLRQWIPSGGVLAQIGARLLDEASRHPVEDGEVY